MENLEAIAGRGCNLLCKTRRFEGCFSVMWITRGISKSGEDESSVKRCLARGGSVHPVFRWRREGSVAPPSLRDMGVQNAPQQHPSRCRPHAGTLTAAQPARPAGFSRAPWLGQSMEFPPDTASPSPGHPQVSPHGASSLGSEPKP